VVTSAGAVLTVMAHADDAELWAGGTLAHRACAGAQITIVVSRSDGIRDQEAAAGAEILGAVLHLLDELDVSTLQSLIADVRPEVVVTHCPDDIHPDHRAATHTVLAALPEVVIATGQPRRVYVCDGYNGLDRYGYPLDLPVIVDVTDTWRFKLEALRAHASQPIAGHFEPMAEVLGRLHSRRIERPYAEAFRAIPVLGRLPDCEYL
jgi:LmbE family N-acetylglucosaminyl deacetylase